MKKFTIFANSFLLSLSLLPSPRAGQILDARPHHLRTGLNAEWDSFALGIPEGEKLEIRFDSRANQLPSTLFIDQSDVKWDWPVELNGHKLGKLFPMESDLVQSLAIPPGTLHNGENLLRILPPPEPEDIVISKVAIADPPIDEAIGEATLRIKVRNEKGAEIPCRITIAGPRDQLAAIVARPGQKLAVRPGVAYTGTGNASLGIRAGDYVVYATRGFEYSLAQRQIKIRKGETRVVNLELRRQVCRPGLASCDTHVHTFTYSKHGDATIEERMLTLAGEGIELPVATDHNIQIDYSQVMRTMGVEGRFTPISGNEVTTGFGHFNVFPLLAGSTPPDYKLADWPRLMESIRASPGVEVVILNHPRNLHNNFVPFARTNFNNVTGENLRGPEFSFDAMELINSGALRSELMQVYRDWFALLNHGYRVTAIGSSDSHDVSRYIVGQGRTYIYCNDRDPGQIDVKEATSNLRSGKALVSLGLLTEITVNEKYKAGDFVSLGKSALQVNVKVFAPGWITATNIALYANGEKIREKAIRPRHSRNGLQAEENWVLPKPAHDLHLVALATGPGVSKPYWAIAKPYQPDSRHWEAQVAGSTNPVWVDADGDGRYSSPRAYAKTIIEQARSDPPKVIERLAAFDRPTAIQAASLLHDTGVDPRSPTLNLWLETGPAFVRAGFLAYSASIEK